MKGHIRQRGKRGDSWELKYDAPHDDGDGRRIVYRTVKGSRRDARAELTRLLAQVVDGAHIDPSRLTVRTHLEDRLTVWKNSGKTSPKTAERYHELFTRQIVPFPIANRPLQKLTTKDIETWHSTLQVRGRFDGKGGVSTATIDNAHRLLRTALADAVRHNLVVKNVCTIQRAPKAEAEEMAILTPEQVAALPALLDGHPLAAAALAALFTGMRRGEILALRWGNTDLDAKVIRVRESLEETKAGLRFKAPKSKAGIRDITLPAIVIEVLQAHRKQLLERRLQLGQGKLADKDLVFPTWDGSPQRPNTFGSTWSRLAQELGLVPFHGLRHTHASQLIDAGVDVVTIARRLGHSSPTVTLQVYAHLFQKDDSKAAAAINAALGR
jgi:integrase